MRRILGCVLPFVVLCALGAGLASAVLAPDFDPPQLYDGDEDDAGQVEKLFSQWIDPRPIDHRLLFIPTGPRRWLAASRASKLPQVVRGPLGSRAPPA